MKIIEKYIICLTVLFLVACQDDEYDAPDTVSDVTWYTSITPGNDFIQATEGFISFLDASQGEISHEWTIEEGNFFLKTGFTNKDSLPLFIDKPKGLSTSDKTAHVIFMKEGINKVCLTNVFEEKVSYQTVDGPIDAVQEGDKWVFEKCFEVDVLSKEIKPAFKVLQDGVEILNITADDEVKLADADTWPIIDVEVNKTLTFVDETTVGRPNDRKWVITGGAPATSNEATFEVAFLNYGTTENLGRIESMRIDPLPNKVNWKYIPLKVRVVSSSAPFNILSEITEDENEKLSFQLGGIIDPASLVGQNGNFTVNVTNGSFNQDIPVRSIEINSIDKSILELTLDAPIYNSDDVTVSYSGGGIMSTDERSLDDFSNMVVKMHFEGNVLADVNGRFSFETYNDSGPNRGDALGWWAQHTFYQRTDEIEAADGDYSFRFIHPNFEAAGGGMTSWGPSDLQVPAGTYKMTMQVYMEAGSDLGGIRVAFDPWNLLIFDSKGIAKEQWVTLEGEITQAETTIGTLIQVHSDDSPGVTGPQTMYIDDIQMIPLEPRL